MVSLYYYLQLHHQLIHDYIYKENIKKYVGYIISRFPVYNMHSQSFIVCLILKVSRGLSDKNL